MNVSTNQDRSTPNGLKKPRGGKDEETRIQGSIVFSPRCLEKVQVEHTTWRFPPDCVHQRLAAGRFPLLMPIIREETSRFGIAPGLCGCAPVGFPDHGSAPSSETRQDKTAHQATIDIVGEAYRRYTNPLSPLGVDPPI
jgi:hypothetical protein